MWRLPSRAYMEAGSKSGKSIARSLAMYGSRASAVFCLVYSAKAPWPVSQTSGGVPPTSSATILSR